MHGRSPGGVAGRGHLDNPHWRTILDAFPRTQIEHLSVPRMIPGTNWFLGCTHTTRAKDRMVSERMTAGRVADILEVFTNAGIDALLGYRRNEMLIDAVKDAEDRTGKRIIRICTPGLEDLADTPQAMGKAERVFDDVAALGVDVCMPHQCTTDALVDRRTHTIRNMDKYCAMIRQRGMIPGLSTHMPESIPYADESGLDVGTYIQLYNAIGFLMQLEVDWVHRIITGAAKPVITIKPFAASRLHPFVGLSFAWATLRDCDMVTVGTQTPDEARELIEISLAHFQKRSADVELQRTRSKASVERQ